MYGLAELLHKSVAEIGEMSVEEFAGWAAWLEMKRENAR